MNIITQDELQSKAAGCWLIRLYAPVGEKPTAVQFVNGQTETVDVTPDQFETFRDWLEAGWKIEPNTYGWRATPAPSLCSLCSEPALGGSDYCQGHYNAIQDMGRVELVEWMESYA